MLSFLLASCSSLELSKMPSSESEAQRILAMNLTYAENLIEANKLKDPHMVSVVVGKLTKAEDKKNNDLIELEEMIMYSENVKTLDNNSRFIGSEISDSRRRGLLDNYDYQEYFLQGKNNNNNSLLDHQIHLSIKYTSDTWREYYSASVCDKWDGCSKENQQDIQLILSDAGSCLNTKCEFREVMALNLTDEFLRSNMDEGFSIGFNSKKFTNKITIPPSYIKGYLLVAK